LLRAYDGALLGLKPVERKLMQGEIKKLSRNMEKGVNTHNWFSLSIDQYILECKDAIEGFQEKKSVVVEHAKHIDKAVKTIENATIVKPITFDHSGPLEITDFFASFEVHRKKVLNELVGQYKNIGDQYLNSIKEST
jgi:hypothetical protein